MSSSEQFPFWKGCRAVVPSEPHQVLPSADPDLAGLLQAKRPLLLVARNSGSVGRAGCRSAAIDLHEAAGELRDRYGIDFAPCLPGAEVLSEWLFASTYKVKSTSISGNEFVNRFVVLDFRPLAPLVVSLSAGSGYKEDAEFSQPHAAHLRNGLLSDHAAFAGFFAKRFDRLVRSLWSTGQLLQSLRTLGDRYGSAWGADGDGGRWPVGETADLMFAMRGNGAQMEALQIVRKRKTSLRRLTGSEMVHGRVPYVLAAHPPPGLMTYKDRVSGRGFLALDTPSNYPDVNDTRGLPNVRDDGGKLVDQVENVQWLLSQWGRPGVRFVDLVEELRSRRFSTQGLRAQKNAGPAAHWGRPLSPGYRDHRGATAPIRRMFTANLHLYETGELVRYLYGEPVVITGVAPPGGWATAEDLARIRGAHEEGLRAHQRRSHWSWAGMPVMVDGVPKRLRAVRAESDARASKGAEPDSGASAVRWGFNAVDETAEQPSVGLSEVPVSEFAGPSDRAVVGAEPSTRSVVVPSVPDEILMAALVEGLVAVNGEPLREFVAAGRDETARLRDEQRLLDLNSELDVLRAEQRRARNLLNETDENGTPLAGAALRKAIAVEFEARAERIDVVEQEATRSAALIRAAAAVPSAGISPSRMSDMINGLKEPRANDVRHLLRDGVRNLCFTSTQVAGSKGAAALRGTHVAFAGELVLAGESASWSVPFAGEYQVGEAFAAQERALRALARLRRGEPRRGLRVGAVAPATADAADLLANSTDGRVTYDTALAISNCGDEDFLRLLMAVMFPEPAEGEAEVGVVSFDSLLADPRLVADFGDLRGLASNIVASYDGNLLQTWMINSAGRVEIEAILSGWREPDPPYVGAAYENFGNVTKTPGKAARWARVRGRRPTLTPCPWCGSRLAGVLRIREVSGYLCLEEECRRDESGVRWPSRFDAYVSRPLMYAEVGVKLNVPEGFTGSAREMRSAVTSPVVPLRGPRAVREK